MHTEADPNSCVKQHLRVAEKELEGGGQAQYTAVLSDPCDSGG